jgi:hypothetical protein
MRMRRVVICGLQNSTVLFPTLAHGQRDFQKEKFTENKMCVGILSAVFVWNVSLSL